MFCFGCACLIQDIQGWGFGQAIIVGAILSAALTSRCLTFQTTASPLFHLLVDTWKLDNCLGFRCLLVKVGLLGFLQFATIVMLWSPQFEDHPNQQSVTLIRFFWVNFVENMRQALLCLVWCHMVVFLAIHLLIFQLLKAVTSSRARANFWTLHCATRKGQEIFEFELWKEKYFQDLFDNNNNPCDYSQNCTVYTVIVSNFWFWVGISEKKKRVAPHPSYPFIWHQGTCSQSSKRCSAFVGHPKCSKVCAAKESRHTWELSGGWWRGGFFHGGILEVGKKSKGSYVHVIFRDLWRIIHEYLITLQLRNQKVHLNNVIFAHLSTCAHQ